MEIAENRRSRILYLIEKYIQGLTIEDISKALSISRTTAARDLEVLATAGKLKIRQIGKTKLHSLPKYFREIKFAITFFIGFILLANLAYAPDEGIITPNATSSKRGDFLNMTFNLSLSAEIVVKSPSVNLSFPNGTILRLQLHNESTNNITKTNYTFRSYDPTGSYMINITNSTNFINRTNVTLNNNITITLESPKLNELRRIVSRVNRDVYTLGRAYYASDNSSVNSTQMNASYETSAGVTLLGTNDTNSTGDYMFTFRFTYPINFTYIVAINDTNNNQGRNTTTATFTNRVLFAKFVSAHRIGTSKTNDVWRLGTPTLWNFTVGSSDPNTRMDASNLTLPYICTYDQAQYSDGIFVSLIHTGDKKNLEYVNFSNVASNDFYKTELKQTADGASTLLAFGKGNCADVDTRLATLSGQTIPNVPIGTYSLGELSETRIQISLQYDRLLVNGTDRFQAGNNKLCVKNVKITAGNEPLIDVRRC